MLERKFLLSLRIIIHDLKVFLKHQHRISTSQLPNLWKMCLFYRSICLNCNKLGSYFIDCHIKKDCRKQLFEFEPENAYFKYCIKCSKEDDTQHIKFNTQYHVYCIWCFFSLFYFIFSTLSKYDENKNFFMTLFLVFFIFFPENF
jgi:hypothetical protein